MLIASLRDVIRNQAAEIEKLQSQLKALSTASTEVRLACRFVLSSFIVLHPARSVAENPY